MGDTAYVGKRVACPVCLQEIVMPEPPRGTPAPARDSSVPVSKERRRMVSMPMVLGLAVFMALASAAGMYIVAKQRVASAPTAETSPATPAPAAPPAKPSAQVSVAEPPLPALAPGHYKILNQAGLSLTCITNTVGSNISYQAVLQPFDGTQIWDIRQVDTNYAINLYHGPCLQLATSRQPGEPLELAKWVHVPRQIWTIITRPDGIYEIRSAANTMFANAPIDKSGQLVVQDNFTHDSFSRHWFIQPARQ
ncbi:MAG TPA: hypothetical protein VF988_02610 [Verrucomicrobiae bacterium]